MVFLANVVVPVVVAAIAAAPAVPEWAGLGTPKLHEVSGVNVSVFDAIKVEGLRVPLAGWGIREKSLGLFSVNVYAAVHYCGLSAYPKVLEIVSLRDVSGEKVRGAYEDALVLNGHVVTGALKNILDRVATDARKGGKITLIAHSSDRLSVVDAAGGGPSSFEGQKLSSQFFSIWFGTPVDSGLKDLQIQLLAGHKARS